MKTQRQLVIMMLITIFSGTAFAEVETGLVTRPKPDYSKAAEIQDELEETSLDTEMAEAESVSLKGIKNDALREEAILKHDLKRLESQEAQLKTEIEGAKRSADQALVQVDKQKLVNLEARKRLLETRKSRNAALAALAKVNDQLRVSREHEQLVRLEERRQLLQIGLIEEEQQTLLESTNRLEASTATILKNRRENEQRLARAVARKKELEAKAQRANINAEAVAPRRKPVAPASAAAQAKPAPPTSRAVSSEQK